MKISNNIFLDTFTRIMQGFMVVGILLGGEIAKAACGVPTMECRAGHCVVSGTGLLQLNSTLNVQSLTIAQEQNADCGIVLSLAQGNNDAHPFVPYLPKVR